MRRTFVLPQYSGLYALISHSSLLSRGKKREVSVSVSQGLDGISGLLSRNLNSVTIMEI